MDYQVIRARFERKAMMSSQASRGINAQGTGMTATELLREDHETVSGLFDQYELAIEEERDDKQAIAEKICNELEIHAEIEEGIFYPRVQEYDEDLVIDALEEHNEMKDCIAELKALSPADAEYDSMVLKLMEIVEHHVEQEEDKMFPRVEEQMAEGLVELGQELEQRKRELKEERGLA